MSQIHLPIFVVQNGLLNDCSYVKFNVLKNGVVEDSLFLGHFTYICTREEPRSDEVLPCLGHTGEVLSFEVCYLAF